MELKVPLCHFTAHLTQVKEKRPDFPHLDEVGWLTDNFKFSDRDAIYEPEPDDPYKTLMFQLARN
jgi:hypothetical protein